MLDKPFYFLHEKYKYVLNAKEKKHLIIWLNSTNINGEITPDQNGNLPKNNWENLRNCWNAISNSKINCPMPDYKLLLTFEGGKKRIFDFTPLLEDKINEPLKDINYFMTAKVHHHTVMWNEKLDICPEYLYEKSVKVK